MTPSKLLDILSVAAKLKTNMRHCYTADGRRESVADHSYRLALFAFILSNEPEFADTDMDKVIKMCLIHDLGEAFTGDVPSFDKTAADIDRETDAYYSWVASFPDGMRQEWTSLLDEMRERETKEAKTFKALDKLEAVISHNESDIKTWLPLEYDLQLSYGSEEVGFSAYLKKLKSEIDDRTKHKIENEKTNGDCNER